MNLGQQATRMEIERASLLSGYSLEMTAKDIDALQEAAATIARGTMVAVPFLPGERLEARVAAAVAIKRLGFVPVPHISARLLRSAVELDEFLGRLREEAEIDRAFVVGGDSAAPMGPFEDALAVIESGFLTRYGIVKVGMGGYPEGHPQISDETLWQALLHKSAALEKAGMACEIMTQFGFDEEPILTWLERLRAAGVHAPVRVGLPGPASAKTLLRFAARCGVTASTRVLKKYGISVTKLLGTSRPDRLLRAIEAGYKPQIHGDIGIHLYPFGGLKAAADWARRLV